MAFEITNSMYAVLRDIDFLLWWWLKFWSTTHLLCFV